MELTPGTIERAVEAYAEEEPLYPVEEEAIETYPAAFAKGEFGWRDAEWVVQWHYRRFLGSYPEDRRREGEERFGENERSPVREAVLGAANAEGLTDRVDHLRELEGVDLPVASAFLQFIDPERYLAVDGPGGHSTERVNSLIPIPIRSRSRSTGRFSRPVGASPRRLVWTSGRSIERSGGSGGRTRTSCSSDAASRLRPGRRIDQPQNGPKVHPRL